MKECGSRNIRKHRDIKGSDKYVTLKISSKFGSLDKMKITSLEPKDYLVISGKGLVASLGLKTIVKSKKNKKAKVCHY